MIFTILKVIGIILLVVLALILAVVLCILFVPVKYRAVGSFDNTDIRVKAHVSWLLHLLALHIEYAREADGYIRLIFVKKKLFEDSDSDYEDDSEYEDYEAESDYENDEYDEKPAESDSGADNYEILYIDSMDDDAKEEDKGCENTGDEPEYVADEQTEDESTAQTHQKTYKKRNKKSHKKQFKDKSDKIKTGIDKLKKEYSDERNKAAFSHLKKELFIILKRICPRRLRLTMVYSTGSPDTTGISLGILACFPVGYTNRWRITPDFESEKPYGKGSFDIKGHVIVISILAATLRILFDKNCRRLYNRISR